MTNEELDRARVDEAIRTGNGIVGTVALTAARLAREGWTPPESVDTDLAEAEKIRENSQYMFGAEGHIAAFVQAIKRGRELERAEAKPGMVWVKHDGSEKSPVIEAEAKVLVHYKASITFGEAKGRDWPRATHYAIITQPEDAA